MTKKGVQIIISGAQRRTIDVDAVTQIVIALGKEIAERAQAKKRKVKTESVSAEGEA
jgi:hypothetical protein